MRFRTLVLAAALLMFILGIGGQATAGPPWSAPPSYLQMLMPDVTFNTTTKKLAVADPGVNVPLAANTLANGNLTAGVADFDPTQPYFTALNGTVFSRKLGWNDPAAVNLIQDDINSVYGFQADGTTPRGYVWIQSLSQSPGLTTYQAIGVNGIDPDITEPIYPTIYPGIFGTAGSSTKWLWDTQMDHNAYAVPFSFLTKPNQIFSAYYKLYVGDAAGNELLTDLNGVAVASASTTTVWTWQGPPFVFSSQTGVAVSTLVESDVFTHTGASAPISVTGGEYAISLDGITWGGWTSLPGTINTNDKVKVRQTSSATAGTATVATLAIPTATGSGTFRVTTAGTNPVDTVPAAFAFTSLTIAPASTITESSVVTVSGINAPAPITVTGGQYAVSTDGGLSWGAWTNIAATVADTNQVKVRLTSSATPGASASATLTIGGVSAAFSVTTGSPVTPSTSFSSVTNAPANTSVSGMPFYVTSNPIAASTDSTISVSGGITPQYSVSTDGGYNWSTWSSTTPATVTAGTHVKVRVVPATTAFTTSVTNLNLGGTITSFSVTTTHANPPSWMPMAMLNVAYDAATKKLTVQDLHTHASFPGTTLPALTYVPAGAYDPTKPWGGLSNGVFLSRQLGWDDPTALHGAGITVTGGLVNQILTTYGSTASIWIERIDQSPGLETYFADGMFGVGGTSSGMLAGTPQPYSNMMTGFPIIYANNYNGIFGTAGSSTKWKWDGTMIHNVYAVPAAYVTQPDQVFSATYKVYVGDALGNEIFNADSSSTSTLETWSWKAPATVQPSVSKLDWVGAQVNNGQGTLKVWWPNSYTAGATFTVTATPVSGRAVSVSGITALYYIFNGLPNGVYTVTVKADKAGMLSSIKAAAAAVTLNKVVPALDWVGAQVNNGSGTLKAWWPNAAIAGATYTVTLTPAVGLPTVVSGITDTYYLTTALPNGTYTVSVVANYPTWTSSAPTTAAPVVLNKVIPALAWVGAQVNNGSGTLKAWWPNAAIAGATYTVTLTPAVGLPTVVSGITDTYYLTTTLPNDTYTVSVVADYPTWTSSTPTTAAPVVLNAI